jgi:LPXTG-site transpeptidase (sortase) family protein
MRHVCSTRLPITLTVLLFSAVFGVAATINQLKNATPTIEELQIQPVLPSEAGLEILPTAIHEAERYSMFVPALGLTARLIHLSISDGAWNVDGLGENVGHLIGTSWFDRMPSGNIVLAGHVELRDGRPGSFARLDEVPLGEIIVIRSDSETRRYRVIASYETEPSDLSPLYPSQREILTLITCSDYDFWANSYHTRLIVVAERI